MRYKAVIPFAILILLTAAVVFVPRAVSDGILFDGKSVEYTTDNKIALTDSRFAEIYVSGGFDEDNIGFPSNSPDEKEADQSLNKLFKKLFGDSAELLPLMTDARLLSFDGRGFLTVSDSRPVGVRLFSAELSCGNAYISIAYEEKTLTLIHLSYYSVFTDTADTKKETMLASEIMSCVEEHYKEHLRLDDDAVYSNLSLEQVTEKGNWCCILEIGLKVLPRYEVNTEKIYNSDT